MLLTGANQASKIAEQIVRLVGQVRRWLKVVDEDGWEEWKCFGFFFSISVDAEEICPVAGTAEGNKVSHALFLNVL